MSLFHFMLLSWKPLIKFDQLNLLPKEAGLLAPNALPCWEKSPPPPVLALPKRLFEVPLVAPNPNPLLVEEVTG